MSSSLFFLSISKFEQIEHIEQNLMNYFDYIISIEICENFRDKSQSNDDKRTT